MYALVRELEGGQAEARISTLILVVKINNTIRNRKVFPTTTLRHHTSAIRIHRGYIEYNPDRQAGV